MRKNREILITTLLSAVMVVQGRAVVSKPKVDTQHSILALSSMSQSHQVANPADQINNRGRDEFRTENQPEIHVTTTQEDKLKLELLGTMVGNKKDPIAFIKDLEKNKQANYRVGSSVNEAKIISIALGEVVIEKAGKKETLRLSKRAREWANLDSDNSIILTSSQFETVVSKRGILNARENIIHMLPALKFKPHYEGKKAAGLIIEGVADESLVKQAGIENKDIIKTVNGQPITSYQKALQVAGKLQGQSDIKIALVRRGELVQLNYRIVK